MVGDILQPTHLIFVLAIALLVLGPKRLPEVGRSLGRGLRDFKEAIGGEDHDRHESISTATVQAPPEPVAPVAAEPVAPVAAEPVAPVAAGPVAEASPAPVGSPAEHDHAG